jgi:hypothetical protein
MVSVQSPPPRGSERVSAYLRRLVAAAIAMPAQRRFLALCGGEPLAILVEADDGVVVHWIGRDFAPLPRCFEGIEHARLAIEAARGRSVRLKLLSDG